MIPGALPWPSTLQVMSRRRAPGWAALVVALVLAAGSPATATGEPVGDGLADTLTAGGFVLASATDWSQRPEYSLRASIEPATGAVSGHVSALLPIGPEEQEVHLRWLPGVVAADAGLRSVTVDGVERKPDVNESLVTLRLPPDHPGTVTLEADFSFTAPLLTPSAAGDDVFDWPYSWLIYNSNDALVLGHWFPIWIPQGLSAEPHLEGRADIGNFPAGTIHAVIEVPQGSRVTSGGVRPQ
jgi:hypothetical protein